MPDPPPVNPLIRYILENPYPLAAGLVVIAVILAWTGREDILGPRVRAAGGLVVAAVAVILLDTFVETAGEHGERVTRELVACVAAGDLTGADRLIAPDATLARASMQNPGADREAIIDGLDKSKRYDLTGTRITDLDGYRVDRATAQVHLRVMSDAGPYGLTPSEWVVIVARQDDGGWKARRIVWISVANRPPPQSY